MTRSAGVAATAVSQSRLAAFLWRRSGALRLGVVVKASYHMRADARMEPTRAAPLDVDHGAGPHDFVPCRAQADVWVTGAARRPRDAGEAMLRLWVSREDEVLVDRSVAVEPRAWAAPGRDARFDLAETALGPSRHAAPFDTRGGIPDMAGSALFQWAPPEQRVAALDGDEWVGVSGAVLEPRALISQLPLVGAIARLFQPDDDAGREIPLALDRVAIDVGTWSCSVTGRGELAADEGRDALHVVGGATVDDAPLLIVSPYAGLHETLRSKPAKAVTLPFQRAMVAPGERPKRAPSPVQATPFDPVPALLQATATSLTETLEVSPRSGPATPFEPRARRANQRPPQEFNRTITEAAPPSTTPIPAVDSRPPSTTPMPVTAPALRPTVDLPFRPAGKIAPPARHAADPTVLPFRPTAAGPAEKRSYGDAFLAALNALPP
jgi:hypothetical protein